MMYEMKGARGQSITNFHEILPLFMVHFCLVCTKS
jgi:hypothetical protein